MVCYVFILLYNKKTVNMPTHAVGRYVDSVMVQYVPINIATPILFCWNSVNSRFSAISIQRDKLPQLKNVYL